MSELGGQLSGKLRKHGTNAEQLIYSEKSLAFFSASRALIGIDMPSIRNVRLYLLFFSIELQLKKILLSDGMSVSDTKNNYKHQIIELYNECLNRSLIIDTASVKNLFDKYKDIYANHLRYYAGLQDVFGTSIKDDEFTALEMFMETLTRVP